MARAEFDLQAPFVPAGDQPKAIHELSERIQGLLEALHELDGDES